MSYEVVVIGSGVVGLSVAYELASRGKFVAVVEKEERFGAHASARNSGILHDGFNRKPGSRKAELCVRGAALMRERCIRWNVPRAEPGTLVVGERAGLERLLEWGRENGVRNLSILGKSRLEQIEPDLPAPLALYSPGSMVIDPRAYLLALYHECVRSMVQFHFGRTAIALEKGWIVRTHSRSGPPREFAAPWVVNAAGVHADSVAKLAGVEGYAIVPYRGEYAEVCGDFRLRHMIYPLPPGDGFSLGIHLTPRPDGIALIGPSTVRVEDKEDYDLNRVPAESLRDEGAKMLPSLAGARVRLGTCGIRAHVPENDFILREDLPGLINCVGIESPGLTSSIAIAQHLVSQIRFS